jgi:hypothetical protein
MSDPLVPNYKKNVGRLVTDRFDFQDHLTGDKFRHDANQIDLFPNVVVDGYIKETVQDAITSLSEIIYSPTIPDATVSSKGAVKLAGDISGTADLVSVVKIQGKPINTIVPLTGQVLTWNGAAWSPETSANVFSAGLDLDGNNVAQKIIQISGNNLGEVLVPANTFTFSEASIPVFSQEDATATNGSNFNIIAQNSLVSDGGNVLISGGLGSSKSGGVTLSLDNNNVKMIQAAQFSDSRRIIALFGESEITDTEVPDGDLILYIKDAAAEPNSGTPSNGVLLYSSNGKLNIKESDGNEFIVGSIPNPSIWGPSGQQTYTSRDSITTTNATTLNIFSYNLPINTSSKLDVIIIGKAVGTADSIQFNLSMGFCTDGVGNITAVGGVNKYDERDTGAFPLTWTEPDITYSASTVYVVTGAEATTTIKWFAISQLTMVSD